MDVQTDVGEVGIRVDQDFYYFRPSFKAMAKIGSPTELASIYKLMVMAYGQKDNKHHYLYKNALCLFNLACKVLEACKLNTDCITPLTGTKFKGKHIEKALPYQDLVVLSFHLLRWGVYGDPLPNLKSTSEKEVESINMREYIAASMVHLGLSKQDAENLTMVEYQRACEVKFPDLKNKEPELSKSEAKSVVEESLKRLKNWRVKQCQAKT